MFSSTHLQRKEVFSYLDQLKYKKTIKNTGKYFQIVRVKNFDMIHHLCRGDPLEKDMNEHLTVKNNDLKKYLKNDKQKVVGDALRNQGKTKQPIFIKKDTVLNHFLNK